MEVLGIGGAVGDDVAAGEAFDQFGRTQHLTLLAEVCQEPHGIARRVADEVVPEAQAAAKRADAVVLVAEAGHTTADQLIDAATGLRSAGANVVGIVLNRV